MTNASQWLANDFNLSDWGGVEEGIGWRVLEMIHIVTVGKLGSKLLLYMYVCFLFLKCVMVLLQYASQNIYLFIFVLILVHVSLSRDATLG